MEGLSIVLLIVQQFSVFIFLFRLKLGRLNKGVRSRVTAAKAKGVARQMTWKIERAATDATTTFLLSGRIDADHLNNLRAALRDESSNRVIDLSQVTLVDVDIIRFLSRLERKGFLLVHCPLYIREWINKERGVE